MVDLLCAAFPAADSWTASRAEMTHRPTNTLCRALLGVRTLAGYGQNHHHRAVRLQNNLMLLSAAQNFWTWPSLDEKSRGCESRSLCTWISYLLSTSQQWMGMRMRCTRRCCASVDYRNGGATEVAMSLWTLSGFRVIFVVFLIVVAHGHGFRMISV